MTSHRLTTLRRLTVMMIALMGAVSVGSVGALLATVDRESARQAFQTALQDASAQYKYRASLGAMKTNSSKILTETEKQLVKLGQEKRAVRLQLGSLRRLLRYTEKNADTLVQDQANLSIASRQEEERLLSFLRESHARDNSVFADTSIGRTLVQRLFFQSLGDSVLEGLHDDAFKVAQQDVILHLLQAKDASQVSLVQFHAAAGEFSDEILKQQGDLDTLQIQYLKAEKTVQHVQHAIELSDTQLAEIKRTVDEVHGQVLKLQAGLARIDARVRNRAKRTLIEKGLRTARPGSHSEGKVVGIPQFSWPALGHVSAGFRDPAYERYFGVPHLGIDIVIAQGTPVSSADDGVVFVVRDGGAAGYTYVLVGHRGGYATLYGHLSAVSVAAGQDISRGQVIGLSGGQPGTPGAGLMTTAAHLHFEVIQQGVNIDPRSVLP